MKRLAVVLFNLGGPDSLTAMEPFLYNLFNDPAIIRVPRIFRSFIAKRIARRRAPIARKIYNHLGGCSPILEQTISQAKALETSLSDIDDVRVFTCMRYWHPRSNETLAQVKEYSPDRIVLLPLYPQFSTTTSASSIKDWKLAVQEKAFPLQKVVTTAVCCYSTMQGFIEAQAELIRPYLDKASLNGPFRLILSAHGLPERIVLSGDPYAWQVENTAKAVIDLLDYKDLDWVLAYQSRVGPLRWIGPSTDDEIKKAGRKGVGLVLAPIAFVSEHSETLVELDIEYKQLAMESGVKCYFRSPTVGTHPVFISALAHLIRDCLKQATKDTDIVLPQNKKMVCPSHFVGCPQRDNIKS